MERKMKKFDVYTLVLSSFLVGMSIVLTRTLSLMVPLGGLPALRIGFGSIPIMIGGILLGPTAGAMIGLIADLLGFVLNPMGGVYFPGFTVSSVMTGIIPGVLLYKVKIQNSRFNFNIINAVVITLFSMGVVYVMATYNALTLIDGNIYFYETMITWWIPIISVLVVLAFIVLPFFFNKSRNEGQEDAIKYDALYFVVSITFIICSLLINTWSLTVLFDKGFMIFLPGRILSGLFTIPIYTFIIFALSKYFYIVKKDL